MLPGRSSSDFMAASPPPRDPRFSRSTPDAALKRIHAHRPTAKVRGSANASWLSDIILGTTARRLPRYRAQRKKAVDMLEKLAVQAEAQTKAEAQAKPTPQAGRVTHQATRVLLQQQRSVLGGDESSPPAALASIATALPFA